MRATENPRVRVLLLEAGPDYPHAIPSDLRNGGRNSVLRHDWRYGHVPNEGQRIPFVFPRGRVVGGSSSVNTCIALRGRPYDYDEWGLRDWTWEKCLPAFKRLETDLDFRRASGTASRDRSRSAATRARSSSRGRRRSSMRAKCKESPTARITTIRRATGARTARDEQGRRRADERAALLPHARACVGARTCASRRTSSCGACSSRAAARSASRSSARDAWRPSACKRVMLCVRRDQHAGHPDALRRGAARAPSRRSASTSSPSHRASRRACSITTAPRSSSCRRSGVVGLDDPLIQTLYRFTSEGSAYPNDMQIQPGSLLPLPRVTVPLVSLMCQVGKPAATARSHGTRPTRTRSRASSRACSCCDDDRARAIAALRLAYEISRERADARRIARMIWPAGDALLATRMHDAIRHAATPATTRAARSRWRDRRRDVARPRARRREPLGGGREPHADGAEREHEPHVPS